jgi:hypothetical protein
MAIGVVMTFDDVSTEQYEAVMAQDALDLRSPRNTSATNDWPSGIVSHVAGPTATGWCVVDVWESQSKLDDFISVRLGPAMAKAGLPQPSLTPFELYNSYPA